MSEVFFIRTGMKKRVDSLEDNVKPIKKSQSDLELLSKGRIRANVVIACTTLILGMVSLLASVLFTSSILAFIGLGLTFWGALLLYITPSRHVSLDLLNAMGRSDLANTKRILRDANAMFTQLAPVRPLPAEIDIHNGTEVPVPQMRAQAMSFGKGIYLPPRYLTDGRARFESSLVFVPSKQFQGMPPLEEIREAESGYVKVWPKGMVMAPSGLYVSRLIEKQIGVLFREMDMGYLLENLPKLLMEDLEIAEKVNMKMENDIVTIEITDHVFNDICREARKAEDVHESVGCPICSAIACLLAKATGRPITIEKEDQSQDEGTTEIQFRIRED